MRLKSHPFSIYTILFFFLSSFAAKADFHYSPNLKNAYQAFLSLKMNHGEEWINKEKRENPENDLTPLINNYNDIITLLISEDAALYQKIKGNESFRLTSLKNSDKKSPWHLYSQAEILLQWAFVKLKFGDEVSAAWNLRQAYKLLEQNNKLYPDFIEQKKSLGFLNIIIGSIPDSYHWALQIMGVKGSIPKGIDQLQEAAIEKNSFQLEARLLKTVIENFMLNKEDKKFNDIRDLYTENPDNLLIHFIYASLLSKNDQSLQALNILVNKPKGHEYLPFPALYFMEGEIYLYKGDYSKARSCYLEFLNMFKGKNLIKDTYYKLFLTHWLTGEDERAMPYLSKVLKSGQTLYDSDKYAQRFAEQKEFPDKILMKARLYTDGGFYKEAFEALNTFSLAHASSRKDKIEYFYRTGRLHHKAGSLNEAIDYYIKTIELSPSDSYYFAPNAALQLGYIYKRKNDKANARNYFQKALTYKNYEYKNTIDNKAKAALNEL